MSNNPTLDVLTEIHEYNTALRLAVSKEIMDTKSNGSSCCMK
jgi:hypothetical protein